MKFTWKVQTGQYQNGEDLYVNRIKLAWFGWNSRLSQAGSKEYNAALRYAGQILLPGLTEKRVYEPTPEAMKEHLEKLVNIWFAEVNREV